MPRYFFNLYNAVIALDEEGVQLVALAAAEAQARTCAAPMIAEGITAGHRLQPDHRIEVENEDREVVFTLRFRDLVDWDTQTND